MKNEAVAKALQTLKQRQLAARVEQSQHLEEIAQKLPEVMEVRAKLAQTSVQLSRLILAHQENVEEGVARIRDANLALQAEEKRLLRENGYPEDYLKLNPVCPLCGDTGYQGDRRCRCLEGLIRQNALEGLNRVSSLRLTSFDSFNLSYYSDKYDPQYKVVPREWMSQVLSFCKSYAEQFTPNAKGILMFGETGLGKTHLSLSIASEVISRGYGVAYGSTQDFLRQIEQEHFHPENGGGGTLDQLLDADLLILDDLGAEFSTQFTRAAVYNILNTRLNREKPTILSTNLTWPEMEERYTSRVVSRVYTMLTCLRFIGQDIRQIRGKQKAAGGAG